MTRAALIPALLLTACQLDAGVHQPTLADVSAEADAAVDLIDRSEVLAEAVENEAGEALDLAGTGAGFRLLVQADAIEDLAAEGEAAATGDSGEDAPPPGAGDYSHVMHAATAVLWAELAAATVVGPPAAAIAIAADGELTQIEPWLWNATNTVTGPEGQTATVDLYVAYIGVGWLAEMRLSTSDGAYDDTLWFNGFVSHYGALGWWDIYSGGAVVGVVEWATDGTDAQFGIAALAGEAAGDVLGFAEVGGERGVAYYDASADFEHYVYVAPDDSGEVLLSTYNGGALACWDTELRNTSCD